jgi:hypothetical protein
MLLGTHERNGPARDETSLSSWLGLVLLFFLGSLLLLIERTMALQIPPGG